MSKATKSNAKNTTAATAPSWMAGLDLVEVSSKVAAKPQTATGEKVTCKHTFEGERATEAGMGRTCALCGATERMHVKVGLGAIGGDWFGNDWAQPAKVAGASQLVAAIAGESSKMHLKGRIEDALSALGMGSKVTKSSQLGGTVPEQTALAIEVLGLLEAAATAGGYVEAIQKLTE